MKEPGESSAIRLLEHKANGHTEQPSSGIPHIHGVVLSGPHTAGVVDVETIGDATSDQSEQSSVDWLALVVQVVSGVSQSLGGSLQSFSILTYS